MSQVNFQKVRHPTSHLQCDTMRCGAKRWGWTMSHPLFITNTQDQERNDSTRRTGTVCMSGWCCPPTVHGWWFPTPAHLGESLLDRGDLVRFLCVCVCAQFELYLAKPYGPSCTTHRTCHRVWFYDIFPFRRRSFTERLLEEAGVHPGAEILRWHLPADGWRNNNDIIIFYHCRQVRNVRCWGETTRQLP